jgi:hypothetical protein
MGDMTALSGPVAVAGAHASPAVHTCSLYTENGRKGKSKGQRPIEIPAQFNMMGRLNRSQEAEK